MKQLGSLLLFLPLFSFSQNVGIGEPAPTSKLTVSGNEVTPNGQAAGIKIQNTASTNAWYLRTGAAGTTTPADGFSIADNYGYHLTIRESGNVGVGTILPLAKLHVDGGIMMEGTNLFEFGAGISGKEANAGKVGYNAFGQNALTFVGAGTNINDRAFYFFGEGGTTFSGPVAVTGNTNIGGQLQLAGDPGQNGQVLVSNGSGNPAWADLCQYKNFVSLTSTAGGTWTVPAGVTKILVEVWGAGGGANTFAGGGGGGYVKAHFTVAPGDGITYDVGAGGTGAGLATAISGEASTATVGAVTISASGGQGALFISANNGQAGVGGGNSIPGSFNNYIAILGGSGESVSQTYFQYNATTFYEKGEAGKGGNAGNASNTGGLGQTYLYNTTGAALLLRNGNSASGKRPGGGAASGIQYGATTLFGGTGGNGLVIIHY